MCEKHICMQLEAGTNILSKYEHNWIFQMQIVKINGIYVFLFTSIYNLNNTYFKRIPQWTKQT